MASTEETPIRLSVSDIPREVYEDLAQRASEKGVSVEQEVARILMDHAQDSEGA